MGAVLHMTFSTLVFFNENIWIFLKEKQTFSFRFHWNLFTRAQLTAYQWWTWFLVMAWPIKRQAISWTKKWLEHSAWIWRLYITYTIYYGSNLHGCLLMEPSDQFSNSAVSQWRASLVASLELKSLRNLDLLFNLNLFIACQFFSTKYTPPPPPPPKKKKKKKKDLIKPYLLGVLILLKCPLKCNLCLINGLPSGVLWKPLIVCWQYDMQMFTALLALLWGESTSFSHKGPVMRSFDISFVLIFNKLLNNQLSCWWHGMPWCPYNAIITTL